ncbi:MAG: glycosyltransferase [Planctomycetota bacterium]|nr:glycosyltransferase [Planctomycetota bacterium]
MATDDVTFSEGNIGTKRPVISIVTPCYNEEESIRACYQAVQQIFLEQLPDYQPEHIFCDNASTDRTVEILKDIAHSDSGVKIIVNSRNFGILQNTYNGVLNAKGDAVVMFLPVDLQDPPDLIPEFVKLWESGYEVVFGIRAQRQEGLVWRTLRHVYYRVISRLSYIDYPPDVGDFQLIDRKVCDTIRRFDDSQPFLRMMTFECGFRSVGVSYTWRERRSGSSKNYLRHLVDQGMLGLVSFSTIPIRLCTLLGFGIALMSLLYAVVVVGLGIFFDDLASRGIPTIIVAIFFFGGVQLAFLGLVGEYVLAIYSQVRRRPPVVERERINF